MFNDEILDKSVNNDGVTETPAENVAPVEEPTVELINTNEAAAAEPVEIVAEAIVPEVAPAETEPVVEMPADQPVIEPVAELPAEPAGAEAVVEITTEQTVAESTVAEAAIATETVAASTEETKESKAAREQRELQEKHKELFEYLRGVKDRDEKIDVLIKNRIRGGLRVTYQDMPLFLPASHFSLKRNPHESELQQIVGKTVSVNIHELQEDELGWRTVIVSRKKSLEDDFWNRLNVGDVVEGTISSVASFGVFVDLGGLEGLIHISRLSQVHIHDPKEIFKKGDTIKCAVVEADRAKNRIALSRKELEDSPWKDTELSFEAGSLHKGIVRRITDFGAYIEMRPGVDGLLRNSELSWTKRIKHPSELLTVNTEVEVRVVAVSEEKQNMTLSLKRVTENPWVGLLEKYPIGTEYTGKIAQVLQQGLLVSINDEIDGFMPRSKMKNVIRDKKGPFTIGDEIEVVISDLIPAEESLILAPKYDGEAEKQNNDNRERRQPRRDKPAQDSQQAAEGSNAFTILDMLSEKDKSNLMDQVS